MSLFKNKKVAVDSMILIYLLDEHPAYHQKILTILKESRQIIISTLVYGEILTGFYKKKNTEAIAVLLSFIETQVNMAIKPFDLEIATVFAKLRASYPAIDPPDCIHLATAINGQADIFLSNDKRLKKVEEIPVCILDTL